MKFNIKSIFSKLLVLFIIFFSFLGIFKTDLNAGNQVINGQDSLNAAWMLRTLNGNDVIKEKAGKEVPYLTLNAKDNSVLGSTGCNSVYGKIEINGDEIKFSDMSMTKMFCDDAGYEQDFVSELFGNEVVKYKLENGILTFTKQDKAVMSFEKKQ